MIECNGDDVVECNELIHKASKLKQALEILVDNEEFLEKVSNLLIEEKIDYLEESDYALECFQEGMNAAILTLGSKSWKNGKLKFSLGIEFYAAGEIEEIKETPEVKEPE